MLGYVKFEGNIYPYIDKDENGYLLLIDGEENWIGERQCEEIPENEAIVPFNDFELNIFSVCMEIAETLIKKNRDYGDSYSKLKAEYGDLALIIRQSDKLEWLKTLQRQGNLVNESTTDTKKDGAGYYILDLAYEKVNK